MFPHWIFILFQQRWATTDLGKEMCEMWNALRATIIWSYSHTASMTRGRGFSSSRGPRGGSWNNRGYGSRGNNNTRFSSGPSFSNSYDSRPKYTPSDRYSGSNRGHDDYRRSYHHVSSQFNILIHSQLQIFEIKLDVLAHTLTNISNVNVSVPLHYMEIIQSTWYSIHIFLRVLRRTYSTL